MLKYQVYSWVSVLGVILSGATSAIGAEYYIDPVNSAASDSNPGTAGSPWKTISKANYTLVAGDTVYLKAGVYSDFINPTRSGTPTSPITYVNWNSDSVVISNALYGVYLGGVSNVVVRGINVVYCDAHLYFTGASHNTIAYCTFDQQRGPGMWCGSTIGHSSQYNWLHHCTFSNFGSYTTTTAAGTVMWIGDDSSTTDHSDYNLFENNVIFHGGHDVMSVSGSHNVIRSNYVHNENWYNGWGFRGLMFMGHDEVSTRNLVEGNRIAFTGYPPPGIGGGSAGMSLVSKSNIIRFNCFYGCSESGLRLADTASYPTSPQFNHIYNNTFYTNGQSTISPADSLNGLALANWGGGPIVSNAIKNNLFFKNPASISTYMVNLSDQELAGNWMQSGDPLFVDAVSPMAATSAAMPDFRLKTNSPCIDKGVFLTTVKSASGSGRVLQVADASYFMDGWGIIAGDVVQLQGTAQKAGITNIDYATGTLTLNAPLTWTQNQGLALAYSGAAPDVGAMEFQPAAAKPAPPGSLRVR